MKLKDLSIEELELEIETRKREHLSKALNETFKEYGMFGSGKMLSKRISGALTSGDLSILVYNLRFHMTSDGEKMGYETKEMDEYEYKVDLPPEYPGR